MVVASFHCHCCHHLLISLKSIVLCWFLGDLVAMLRLRTKAVPCSLLSRLLKGSYFWPGSEYGRIQDQRYISSLVIVTTGCLIKEPFNFFNIKISNYVPKN